MLRALKVAGVIDVDQMREITAPDLRQEHGQRQRRVREQPSQGPWTLSGLSSLGGPELSVPPPSLLLAQMLPSHCAHSTPLPCLGHPGTLSVNPPSDLGRWPLILASFYRNRGTKK